MKRRIVSGGSTITMQTIRLFRKPKARTLWEKTVEIILATRLELKYSKDEILSLYLSHAPYGGNIVGIETAAWRYFGTSSHQLSWAEAATLAVLPNSPALVHPGRNRQILLQKRNRLLRKLLNYGWIDSTTCALSLAEQIPEEPNPIPQMAPHLLDRFCRMANGQVSKTTIRAPLQQKVTEVVELNHAKLALNEIHNAAALVIEVETGNVLAYVGNCGNKGEKLHNNEVDIIVSPRSTGSLLKPLLFAALLNEGKILPGSLVPDIPMNLSGFSPLNFDGQFEGVVKASQALSKSLNVPLVCMLQEYGIERYHHLLRSLGMRTLKFGAEHYGLALILGGAEGDLEEMTNIYASLARVLNHYCQSGLYYSIDYRSPNYFSNYPPKARSANREPDIFYASAIYYPFKAMEEVNRPDEEIGWKQFGSSRRIAWKTGTSFGYKRHHSNYKSLPTFGKGCELSGKKSMDLIYPREATKIFVPVSLKGEKGRVVFEAVHSNPKATIYWHLDHDFLAVTTRIHQVSLSPASGNHLLTLVDENGEEIIRHFTTLEP
jgi:penicillin-binding protein 1C